MMQDDDEYDVFGCFVVSESRSLKQDSNRRRLKRIIQRAILDVAEDDAESGNSSTQCVLMYDFPDKNSQITW